MKGLVNYALVAVLAAEVTAHSHHHFHRHAKKHAAYPKVDQPSPNPAVVESPVETVYHDLQGKIMDNDEAVDCLHKDMCKIVSSASTSQVVATSTVRPLDAGAKFMERPSSAYLPPTSTSSPLPLPKTTAPSIIKSILPLPKPELPSLPVEPVEPVEPVDPVELIKPIIPKPVDSKPDSGSDSGDSPSLGDPTREFPSGKIPCSHFPSDYGARPLEHQDCGSWTGIQHAQGHNPKTDNSVLGLANGNECVKNSYCSYACPNGWEKAQWPEAQGANGESVGGLWCNSQGFLELTRPRVKSLCQRGLAGLSIKSSLDQNVTFCRTDYPGTENMVIPTVVRPGKQVELTNPIQNQTYQKPNGQHTSAQYYVNPSGLTLADACTWKSTDTELQDRVGNWAPVNVGVSFNGDSTFLGLFPNKPTAQNVALNYNIAVKCQDVVKCSYTKGTMIEAMEGCTASFQPHDKIVIEVY
ncbi:hypothetical protein CDD83_8335 [Cordyceps sp. RAO-2017]|nr:hypothetical protein CDD83_8335 [Cordyceps sp. RAO-2017]